MKKIYHTKAKTLILDVLQENKECKFSATKIYELCAAKLNKVNLTTVYRNLDKMTEDGLLSKSKSLKDDCFLYQYVDNERHCHEHLHMQCEACGRIYHLECDFMKEIAEHLRQDHGFVLDCDSSTIVGKCSECQDKSSI